MKTLSKKQKPPLLGILEVFNHSLVIRNFIEGYIVNNPAIRDKKALLKKAKKASQLISEIHQHAHLQFCIETTVDKHNSIEKIIHKRRGS